MEERERCETCRFWGRVVDHTLAPPGQCRRNAPGKYTVTREVWYSGKLVISNPVGSPFPGVSTGDWCGEYDPGGAADV